MWARIENESVAEITDIDPDGRFHPSLIWMPCAEGVKPGWLVVGGKLKEPKPDPAQSADQVRAERRAAYVAESDHLKIEAEHDAVISGGIPDYAEWLLKVEEIKTRYPLPA